MRHHNLRRGEDDRLVHSDDLELITSACTKYDMDAEQFCELLEGYGGDHLKRTDYDSTWNSDALSSARTR